MFNLNFKYIAAYNFLCFGPEGIELNLETMGNIVLINGKNWHDVDPVTGKPGSNGSGKSSIFDIISYALFGKITRDKTVVSALIHKEIKKKLKVEIIWDKYRVVRCRKPDHLQLWESEEGIWDDSTEITCGAGAPETQKKIEAILGMNHKSFVSVAVFDDRNDHAVLEMDGPTKRVFIENLLSLEKYREYNKVAKAVRLEADKSIKAMSAEYERLLLELDIAKRRVHQVSGQQRSWRENQQERIDALLARIQQEQHRLESSDTGSALVFYNQAQENIANLNRTILADRENQERISRMTEEIKTKKDSIRLEVNTLTMEANYLNQQINELKISNSNLEHKIQDLGNLEAGVACSKCFGTIDPKNAAHVIEQTRQDIFKQEQDIAQYSLDLKKKQEQITQKSAKLKEVDGMIQMAGSKNLEISTRISKNQMEVSGLEKIDKPSIDKDLALINQRIADLKQEAENRKKELDGPSPFDAILLSASEEVNQKNDLAEAKRQEITKAEKMIPYFKFWVNAFGDDGIRKFVIDGIIPALNSQIEYWLDILIYGNLKLRFDNMLEPTIERVPFDDDPFIYSMMSGGERRRMNLAVIHSAAHIQMLNCGACPSVLFLDEVVTNIDTNGKVAAFDMIQELATNRQVFVTTHDPELLDLLQGCQTINLERRDGITRMIAA
jgi:DNA repair exonuclease SbcCD ATPase subunit